MGIPTVRDRVVQAALKMVIEPIFEAGFHPNSHGFRPGRKAQDALGAVQGHLKAGLEQVIDADLKGYFDSIPHERLLAAVGRKIADGRILELIRKMLKAGIMEDLTLSEPDEGTPQGGVISPLLANIYLDGLDHLMAQHGHVMERYADDFVILCRTSAEAAQALALVQTWTAQPAPAAARMPPVRPRGASPSLRPLCTGVTARWQSAFGSRLPRLPVARFAGGVHHRPHPQPAIQDLVVDQERKPLCHQTADRADLRRTHGREQVGQLDLAQDFIRQGRPQTGFKSLVICHLGPKLRQRLGMEGDLHYASKA